MRKNFVLFSFIGISQSLPSPSYVKMIDIWMLATLLYPFMEVILHTYKEMTTRNKINPISTNLMMNGKPAVLKHCNF